MANFKVDSFEIDQRLGNLSPTLVNPCFEKSAMQYRTFKIIPADIYLLRRQLLLLFFKWNMICYYRYGKLSLQFYIQYHNAKKYILKFNNKVLSFIMVSIKFLLCVSSGMEDFLSFSGNYRLNNLGKAEHIFNVQSFL